MLWEVLEFYSYLPVRTLKKEERVLKKKLISDLKQMPKRVKSVAICMDVLGLSAYSLICNTMIHADLDYRQITTTNM